jgi:hypothetical protein
MKPGLSLQAEPPAGAPRDRGQQARLRRLKSLFGVRSAAQLRLKNLGNLRPCLDDLVLSRQLAEASPGPGPSSIYPLVVVTLRRAGFEFMAWPSFRQKRKWVLISYAGS